MTGTARGKDCIALYTYLTPETLGDTCATTRLNAPGMSWKTLSGWKLTATAPLNDGDANVLTRLENRSPRITRSTGTVLPTAPCKSSR